MSKYLIAFRLGQVAVLCGLLMLTNYHAIEALEQYDLGIKVEVYATPEAGGIRYHYTVTNNLDSEIERIWIGWDGLSDFLLRVPLVGWTDEDGLAAGSTSAPVGWSGKLLNAEEEPLYAMEWQAASLEAAISAGESEGEFTVLVPGPRSEYQNGRFHVLFSAGGLLPGNITTVAHPRPPGTKRQQRQRGLEARKGRGLRPGN